MERYGLKLDSRYKITKNGDVYSYVRDPAGVQLTRFITKDGIDMVSISGRGGQSIHILLAQTFVDNPHGYMDVKFTNDKRRDIRADNVMWVKSKRWLKKYGYQYHDYPVHQVSSHRDAASWNNVDGKW